MLRTDRVAGGALVLVALVVFWESRRLPLGSLRNPGPAYMPVALAAVLMCLGSLLIALAGKTPPPVERRLDGVAARGGDLRRLRLRGAGARAARLPGDHRGVPRVPPPRRRAQGIGLFGPAVHRVRRRRLSPLRHVSPGPAATRAARPLMAETLQNLGLGFSIALSPPILLYAFVGCAVGTLVGVLPGVGPLAGISLLLPVRMQFVATSKPDGYTLLMALSSISIIPEADKLFGRPPAFTVDQFAPIALVSADPTILVVPADKP